MNSTNPFDRALRVEVKIFFCAPTFLGQNINWQNPLYGQCYKSKYYDIQ